MSLEGSFRALFFTENPDTIQHKINIAVCLPRDKKSLIKMSKRSVIPICMTFVQRKNMSNIQKDQLGMSLLSCLIEPKPRWKKKTMGFKSRFKGYGMRELVGGDRKYKHLKRCIN